MNGYSDGSFRPNDKIKREEFVKCLVLATDTYDETAECDFVDIDKNAWYYKYVASAVKAGLVSGIGNDMFGTGSNIIRQDIALMIYRTGAIKTQGGLVDFKDAQQISDYALEAVSAMFNAGIINGSDGNFMSHRPATRAEAAKMICSLVR